MSENNSPQTHGYMLSRTVTNAVTTCTVTGLCQFAVTPGLRNIRNGWMICSSQNIDRDAIIGDN